MLLKLYWIMTLCCCIYAVAAGGHIGRLAGALMFLRSGATLVAGLLEHSWQGTEWPLLVIEILSFSALLALVLNSDRYWLIWSAACEMLAVLIHLATIWQPHVTPLVYQSLQNFWAIPMQLFMVRGIALDRRAARARLARRGPLEI